MKKYFILIFVALLPVVTMAYYDAEIDGIYYIFSGNEAEVTSGDRSYYGAVVIPESVTYNNNSCIVTSIGEWAFCGCSNLISVTIPNSVTSISMYAFSNCTSLTSVTIPESVTKIGYASFSGCSALSSVTIPESVPSVEGGAFDLTPWINNQPDGLVYIGRVAYGYKGSMPEGTEIVIKEGTTEIANWAFCNCYGLTSITIPNSVTYSGIEAFAGCNSLTSVHISDIAAWCNIEYYHIFSCPLVYARYLYLNDELITDLIIPEAVTSIGYWAFCCCDNLTSVTIPNGIIHGSAFSACKNLKSIFIGNGVTYLEQGAFSYCSSLTDVYCNAVIIPYVEVRGNIVCNPFKDTPFEYATLHVPAESLVQYKVTEPWSSFGAIVALTEEDAVTEVKALPVLIQTQGGTVTIQGAAEGTPIAVYDLDGRQYGTALADKDRTTIATSLRPGSIAVVKIGEKSVKVLLK